MLSLLAEPAATLGTRLQVRPQWVSDLAVAYWFEPASQDTHQQDGIVDGSGNGPFGELAVPLLSRARRRLADRLAGLPVDSELPFDPRVLLAWLYLPLPRLVDRMLMRAMTLELNVARALGTLPGDSATARFDAFCARLGDHAERRRLICSYPVLGRLLAAVASNWVEASSSFAARLTADWPLLAARFAPDGRLGPVTGVFVGLGDSHRRGQTVMTVACANGVRFVYKPRSLAPDQHVGALVEWLAARGLNDPPRLPCCVDRGAYGWAQFVAARSCTGPHELRRFYRRLGALLAVLYVLRANDISGENLIAAGEHPVPVDLETICQPELAAGATATPAEQAAAAAASSSVLRVGLLPTRVWGTAAGASVDLSALGDAAGQLSPIASPEVIDAGTDRMRLQLRRQPLTPAANRPVDAGSPLRLLDYLDDVLAGFTETYQLCCRHRDELLARNGPLAAFAGDDVRVVLRSTAEYALLRDAGHHPDVLRDGLDADRHFDRLWRGVARRPALQGCVEHEREDLWQQDIPLFTARTDELVLRSSAGSPIAGLVRRTGMDSVRRVVAGLGPADLTRQCWLIRTSLATHTMNVRELEHASYPLPASRMPAEPDRLLAEADAIGRHLAGIAWHAPDSAQWLGVVTHRGDQWSLGPLGPDLCTGLSGLALFYGFLGAVGGEPAHTALARAALATARAQVDRRAIARSGGSAGLGGIIYAVTQLGVLWHDDELLDHALTLAVLSGQWAADDEQFDFTSGSAGTIAALRALHAVRPDGRVRDAVRACANRVLAGRVPAGRGAAWLPRLLVDGGVADVPLAGFAHGAAGVAWPLLEAAQLCADQRYHDAALAAIAYERGLFVPEAETWRDQRRSAGGAPFDCSAWCHGAAGVGLARVRSLPHLADATTVDEIGAAVRNTIRTGFGLNHSLCHGDLGNLELLVLAADATTEPRWCDRAQALMGTVMDSIDEHGWISGLPHGVQTPGLLHGLAGTGYGLLRMAAPRRVPSVLTFDPPPVS